MKINDENKFTCFHWAKPGVFDIQKCEVKYLIRQFKI